MKWESIEQMREYHRNWYYKNQEQRKLDARDYYSRNIEKCRKCSRRRYAKYSDRITAAARLRYSNNRKSAVERVKKYYRDNKDKVRAYWSSRKTRDRVNAYLKQKRESDINFKIKCNLYSRLRSAIYRSLSKKTAKTQHLIGCDIDFLKEYLETRFGTGMSWNNYGKWHIDHIVPCAEFDLRDKLQQKQCFHYSNLQPLWAKDNLAKGAKINAADILRQNAA